MACGTTSVAKYPSSLSCAESGTALKRMLAIPCAWKRRLYLIATRQRLYYCASNSFPTSLSCCSIGHDERSITLCALGARYPSKYCSPLLQASIDWRLSFQLSFHFILSISHEEYGKATSLSTIQEKWKPSTKYERPDVSVSHHNTTSVRKANAAFVILARNGDLEGVIESIKQQEDRFNKNFGYPYVFLNEEVFTEEFKR